MKKTLFATLVVLLAAVMAVTFVACGKETVNPNEPKSDVSIYKSSGEQPELPDMLNWEAINAFKSTDEIAKLYETDKDAAIKEARQVAVDFFRYCKTAQWIPADSWDFTHHDNGDGPDTLQGGMAYGGLPYVGLASSGIYRLLDFMDPVTGVVNIYAAGGKNAELQKYFGNQCANGAYQGWSRVINSSKYSGTPNMTESNGFYRLGDYVYRDSYLTGWSDFYGTDECKNENKEAVMFASYAKLDVGDGIVNYTTAGHVVMIATKAVVVYKADGVTIDPDKSFVTVIDQTPQWASREDSNGNKYEYQANVDAKWSFTKLYSGNYLPFTYAEWLGNDPIEATKVEYTHSGETITLDQLFNSKVTCNYHIYDIYASIYNADGVEVAKVATHSNGASEYKIQFQKAGVLSVIWGDLESLAPAEYEYTVKVYAQLGTGARPTLWEGKLA